LIEEEPTEALVEPSEALLEPHQPLLEPSEALVQPTPRPKPIKDDLLWPSRVTDFFDGMKPYFINAPPSKMRLLMQFHTEWLADLLAHPEVEEMADQRPMPFEKQAGNFGSKEKFNSDKTAIIQAPLASKESAVDQADDQNRSLNANLSQEGSEC
jgi:hypothetical protein